MEKPTKTRSAKAVRLTQGKELYLDDPDDLNPELRIGSIGI